MYSGLQLTLRASFAPAQELFSLVLNGCEAISWVSTRSYSLQHSHLDRHQVTVVMLSKKVQW